MYCQISQNRLSAVIRALLTVLAILVANAIVPGRAQSRASLTIGGTVSPENSVNFALRSGSLNGAGPKLVGMITEKSNHQLGYHLTLHSAKNSPEITVLYNGLPVNLANGPASLGSAGSRTPLAGHAKALTVSSASPTQDTLVLTITAN